MEKGLPDNKGETVERAALASMAKELSEMEYAPPNGDAYISAFAEAAGYLLSSSPDTRLKETVEDMLRERRLSDSDSAAGKKEEPFTAQYASNLLLRSLQHILLFRRAYPVLFSLPDRQMSYPADFDTAENWLYEIKNTLDDSTAHSLLVFDLHHRRIQSNIAERYKGLKLAINLGYPRRFSGDLDVLDVGASLNLGLTKLMINDGFQPVEVLSPPLLSGGVPSLPDSAATDRLNDIISAPLNISSGAGVDILPVWDPNSNEWVKSCSFYPGELLDPRRTNEFDRLMLACSTLDESIARRPGLLRQVVNLNMPRLSHYTGDFSDRNSMRGLAAAAGRDKFHVVSFITMMHQLSDRERLSMIDRAKNYLHPDGLIVIQDFMNISPGAPNGLEFPAHWSEFLYKTVVIDPSRPEEGPREIITWDYGRCRQAVLPEIY